MSEMDPDVIAAARRNAGQADLSGRVTFAVTDASGPGIAARPADRRGRATRLPGRGATLPGDVGRPRDTLADRPAHHSGSVHGRTSIAPPGQRISAALRTAMLWALIYGVVLSSARALGEFGAVSIVSGNVVGQAQALSLYVETSSTTSTSPPPTASGCCSPSSPC